jgi:diazepam-binding inhibitor (GABA receptor modulating acyl-CoA-binding protein)
MSDVEARFRKAAWLISNGPPNPNTSTEEKLKFYSYFKQATEGDAMGTQPWAVQFEARAKWDAWAALKGMSKAEAMQGYVDLISQGKFPSSIIPIKHLRADVVNAGDPNWEQHPAFANLPEN